LKQKEVSSEKKARRDETSTHEEKSGKGNPAHIREDDVTEKQIQRRSGECSKRWDPLPRNYSKGGD